MERTKEHVRRLEAQLKAWAVKIDELVGNSEGHGAQGKVDHRVRLAHLKAMHRAAQAKLEGLKAAGSENWEALLTSADGAWNELDAAFKKTADRVKGG